MSNPVCPFCQDVHDYDESNMCPAYGYEIPVDYLEKYSKNPPLWLVTVGYSQHGKTCFLSALTMMLENLNSVWPTTYFPLDQNTRDQIRQMRIEMAEGSQPKPTQLKEIPQPLLLHMYDIPDVGSKSLIVYDSAGEAFDQILDDEDAKNLSALREVNNIWFLISLKDLEKDKSRRLFDLFNIYVDGMKRLMKGASLEGRNLIVVYTKADKLGDRLPADIKNYLYNDPFQDLTNEHSPRNTDAMRTVTVKDYFDKMKTISKGLEEYTKTDIPTGGAFINLARRSGMGIYFTAMSALGADPDPYDNSLPTDAKRIRVLDPLLWALFLDQPIERTPINLILDGSLESQNLYSNYDIKSIASELGSLGKLTSYYMGRTKPIALPGQSPPLYKPKHLRPRLLGPILEKVDQNVPQIVISTGVIYDLADFSQREWGEQIFIIYVGVEEEPQSWPNNIVIRENETDIEVANKELRRFIKRVHQNI